MEEKSNSMGSVHISNIPILSSYAALCNLSAIAVIHIKE